MADPLNMTSKKVIEVSQNFAVRENMVKKIKSVVDCKGTERIDEEVEKLVFKPPSML